MTAAARTLYRDARVITMNPAAPNATAFLVEGGTIVAVGEDALGQPCDQEISLERRTVLPGFIDAHTHLETAALADQLWTDVREVDVATMVERVRKAAAKEPKGEWVIAQGVIGQSLPDRAALDAAAPDNPVLVRGSMHVLAANTEALRRAGLLDRRFDEAGSIVQRHAGGEPTGIVQEGFHLFPITMPSVEELAHILEREIRDRFSRFGVTTIYEIPFSTTGMAAYQLLHRTGRLNARLSLQPTVAPGLQPLVEDLGQWARMGLATGFGNDKLWLGGAKFFLDGALDADYTIDRDRDHPGRWGALTHLSSDLVRALVLAYESGIQPWIHAAGVDAEHLALDAVTEAQRLSGGDRGLRTRIEHLCNERFSAQLVDRIRAANVLPVPNAVFIHLDVIQGNFPFKTLIEDGFRPPGNSDNAGTQPFATNPWFGIAKMRTRRNKSGGIYRPEERVSLHDALRTYTEFGAYAGHREGQLGVIAPGACADFTVLGVDPFSVPDDELESLESVMTVVDGATVWETA